MSTQPVYYGVKVSSRATSRRGTPWVWSPAFDSPKDAYAWYKGADDLVIGFVVRIGPGGKEILFNWTEPGPAAKVVRHLLDLERMLDERGGQE